MKISVCPSSGWESYVAGEERAQVPLDEELLSGLDAYGHLRWVVGYSDEWCEDPRCECAEFVVVGEDVSPMCKNCGHPPHRGDWLACFDFTVYDCPERGKLVAYHTVVNSDSGGFIDCVEQHVVRKDNAPYDLPDEWAYVSMEEVPWSVNEWRAANKCNEEWNAALKKALGEK